jgi:hypothetical protein
LGQKYFALSAAFLLQILTDHTGEAILINRKKGQENLGLASEENFCI